MILTVRSKYLIFPVNTKKETARLSFSENGVCLCTLRIALDAEAPDFYACVNVARFLGKTLILSLSPDAPTTARLTLQPLRSIWE